jgi:Fuc2NAc and GlcNAc transferase
VAVVLSGALACAFQGWVPARFAYALVGGGVIVATVGWCDDRWGLSQAIRASVHVAAATWAVWNLGGFPVFTIGDSSIQLGAVGFVLAVLAIVWLTNLYNFMDGIDGIASLNTLTVGALAAVLLASAGSHGYAVVSTIIAGASFGFLFWNWAPARIFMGDVGSGFLGFCFGALAIASENTGNLPVVVWFLLLGAFIVDSSITLTRRILRGEQWYAGHNNHAYQRAVRSGYAHATVSLGFAVANGLLGVAAVSAIKFPRFLWLVCTLAVLGLVSLYVAIEKRAPMPVQQEGSRAS